jgi:probable F420-dependent oxidoreductase
VFADLAHTLRACARAKVVTGILNIWAHDPPQVVDGVARLDDEFPERFVLGLGVSHAKVVERLNAGHYRRPLAQMVEYLDALDALGGPGPDRRLLAALGPRMLDLAARRSLGTHPTLTTPEHMSRARALMGPDALVAPMISVVLDDDWARARQVVLTSLGQRVRRPAYKANLLTLGFDEQDFEGHLSDRLIDTIAVIGDVDDVVRAVVEHEQAGADHVAISVLTEVPYDMETIPVRAWQELARALDL